MRVDPSVPEGEGLARRSAHTPINAPARHLFVMTTIYNLLLSARKVGLPKAHIEISIIKSIMEELFPPTQTLPFHKPACTKTATAM